MKISVIIPTYNGAELLRLALRSWKQQTLSKDEYEVIVVDNNSKEDIKSVVDSFGEQNFRYMLETEQGATAARHKGAHSANADILLFADNDGLYNPDCLKEVLLVYEDHPNVDAVTGKIQIQWDTEEPSWIKPYLYMLGKLDYGDKVKTEYGMHLNGGFMSVRKSVFEQLGGFNPDLVGPYLIGDGDTGFVRKLHANNSLIGYTPFAVMQHLQQANKHGSVEGVALHCYNDGVAESYALFRAHGFKMDGIVVKHFIKSGLLYMKKSIEHILKPKNISVYFSQKRYKGNTGFFFLLCNSKLRRYILKEQVY